MIRHAVEPTLCIALLIAALGAHGAHAQATALLPFQGTLDDSTGAPYDDFVQMRFRLYGDSGGTNIIYDETRTVDVQTGWFDLHVGEVTPLSHSLFRDNPDVWLGLKIASDTELPLVQLGTAPLASYAEYAGDAETLGGSSLSEIESGSAIALASHVGASDAHHARYTDGECLSAVATAGYVTGGHTTSLDWTDISGKPAALTSGTLLTVEAIPVTDLDLDPDTTLGGQSIVTSSYFSAPVTLATDSRMRSTEVEEMPKPLVSRRDGACQNGSVLTWFPAEDDPVGPLDKEAGFACAPLNVHSGRPITYGARLSYISNWMAMDQTGFWISSASGGGTQATLTIANGAFSAGTIFCRVEPSGGSTPEIFSADTSQIVVNIASGSEFDVICTGTEP